jgi:sugar/nucleoside kinase (ribokinase family)
VWDAACIAGILAHLEPEDRLLFANAAAAKYVSDPEARSPGLAELEEFMKVHPVPT